VSRQACQSYAWDRGILGPTDSAFASGDGLRPHGIAPVALSDAYRAARLPRPTKATGAQVETLRRAESTPYVGRAVGAPACDGRVMRQSGRTLVVGELTCVYGFTVRRRPAEPPPFRVPPTVHD
jgi:hypothetical protein